MEDMKELSDVELDKVVGCGKLDECISDFSKWMEKHPLATSREIYDNFRAMVELEYPHFTPQEREAADELLRQLQQNEL